MWTLDTKVRTGTEEDTTTGHTTSVFSPGSVQTPSVWLHLCPLGEKSGQRPLTLLPPHFHISKGKNPTPWNSLKFQISLEVEACFTDLRV